MKNNIQFIMGCCLGIVLCCSNYISAQNVTFKFYDVQTGFSITPEEVLLYDTHSNALKNSFEKKDLVRGEAMSLNLKKGNYDIAITASGYKQMDIHFAALDDMTVNRQVMLSPQEVPYEISEDYLRSMHRSDRTLIAGYIADDKGLPLANAKLRSDDGTTAQTNEDGYFQLSLSYDKADFYDMQLKAFNVSKSGFKTVRHEKVVVIPNGDAIYRIQMERGSGKSVKQMSDFIVEDGEVTGRPERQISDPFDAETTNSTAQLKSGAACMPDNISVGYISSYGYCCTGCNLVTHLVLEDYVKQVLDNEWIPSWSNLNNIDEAYKAAAVAARTYASFRVNNPKKPGVYDIAASTCDQDWDPSQPSWATSAGNATEGIILKVNGNILKAEYSSENNNLSGNLPSCLGGYSTQAGCGNGNAKDGISGNCISDPLGTGWVQFGHGRNMSQFGSARWATGLAIGFWCNSPYSGSPHGYGTRSWEQIIDMYYPSHELVYCNGDGPPPPGGGGNCDATLTTVTGTIPSQTYEASSSITSAGKVASSGNVTFKSPAITLKNGFTINSGGTFYAENTACSGNGGNKEDTQNLYNFSVQPNPFSTYTQIKFTLSEETPVTIWITDVMGRHIATLAHQEVKSSGEHEVIFEGSPHATGMYFATIQAGEYISTQKMILTK